MWFVSLYRALADVCCGRQESIRFEAFHVFKVFVANPEKPQAIIDILANPISKPKLIDFLTNFQNEKDDDQFVEEKVLLVDTI